MLTSQIAYDTMREYFSRPGAQLSRVWNDGTSSYRCFYRHPEDGRPCAVGSVIPDGFYQEGFEFMRIIKILEVFNTPLKDLFADHDVRAFLTAAQVLHDSENTTDAAHFVKRLDTLADEFGLTRGVRIEEQEEKPLIEIIPKEVPVPAEPDVEPSPQPLPEVTPEPVPERVGT